MNRAEGEVRPRVFYEDFPNLVLYVNEVPLDGRGWLDVMAADTGNPSQPVLYLARRGRMAIDRAGAHHSHGARRRHAAHHQARGSGGLRGAEVRPHHHRARSRERLSAHRAAARRARDGGRRPRGAGRRAAGDRPVAAPADHGDPQEVLRADCLLRVRACSGSRSAPATARTASWPRSCSASA